MQPIKERFDSKWTPEPFRGCWLWSACVNSSGYGSFGIGSRTDHTRCIITSHRMAWQIYRGEVPIGLHVLHHCDTRCCVNPDHLFLGTGLDNTMDMIKKNRKAT